MFKMKHRWHKGAHLGSRVCAYHTPLYWLPVVTDTTDLVAQRDTDLFSDSSRSSKSERSPTGQQAAFHLEALEETFSLLSLLDSRDHPHSLDCGPSSIFKVNPSSHCFCCRTPSLTLNHLTHFNKDLGDDT
jgi:hypothetical protein